jgi:hypothetical protein
MKASGQYGVVANAASPLPKTKVNVRRTAPLCLHFSTGM